ncbi:MAG: dual specificity protein phosphatase family protein [Myxococcaceae bacterium]|nr:dual specificity protein phosphatase family protein [Myxococcaceae bacterium]
MVARITNDAPRSTASRIKEGLKDFAKDVKADAKELAAALKSGDGREVWKDLKNGVSTFGGEAVGVAGLFGLRYPVSNYEFRVSPGLVRGSRIDDPKGYEKLKQQGVKSLIDLTLEGTKDLTEGRKAGLAVLNIGILDNNAPTTDEMKRFLDFATEPKNQPCYVHCQAGKGRTGVAVACYRMAVEKWPPEKALAEASAFGLKFPDQVDFILQFGADLSAGKIAGYPR